MTTKEQLKKMTYGNLQREPAFKHYLDTYVYSESMLMNDVVGYILKQSYEDSEAPFSYEDIQPYFRYEDMREDLIKEVSEEDEEVQKEVFEQANEEHNRRIKNLSDFEVFVKSLDDDDIHSFVENNTTLAIDVYDYEEYPEVYQWFIMGEHLLRELEDRGEVVLNNCFWGRQCCGQAIEMDSIIIQIFKEWYLELYGLPATYQGKELFTEG